MLEFCAVTDADVGSQQASQIVQLLQSGAAYLTGQCSLTVAFLLLSLRPL